MIGAVKTGSAARPPAVDEVRFDQHVFFRGVQQARLCGWGKGACGQVAIAQESSCNVFCKRVARASRSSASAAPTM